MAARVSRTVCSVLSMQSPCEEREAGASDDPRSGLGCDLLLGCCLLWLRRERGCGRLNGRRLLCFAALLGLRWGKDGLSFGEEVELVLARDADVSGEGKARQLVIGGVVDGGEQNLFGAALVVLVVSIDLNCKVIGEGVGVKVDDGAKQDAELGGGEDVRGVLKDALEGRLPLLAQLVSELVRGFLFLLFALELLATFLGAAVFFGLMLLSALLVFGFALCGFPCGFLLGCGSHNWRGVLLLLLSLPCGCAGIMDRAVVVGANGEGGAYALAVDDDGGFRCLARCNRLGIGIVGVLDLPK